MSTGYADVRAASRPGPVDRVLVNGHDIIHFRDPSRQLTPTRIPKYSLTEPFGYGSSDTLVIPRTNFIFERIGQGDLAFIRPGATVLYQRVYPDGTVITDYRGVVVAARSAVTDERKGIGLDVAGDLSGRAANIDRPQPLVRRVRDVGYLASQALKSMGFGITPANGPVTNIGQVAQGGITQLAWLETLCKYSQTRAGVQRALMPAPWGSKTYSFAAKNTTTKHHTVFIDGDTVRPDFVDDATERPNTFWGTGVDTDGTHWRNSFYPGFFQGPAPDYPMAGGAAFGIGTTNADTIDGDGITVLRIKLANSGLMPDATGTSDLYDQDVYDAVDELKDHAGIGGNGNMTVAAWEALWDISEVGFSPGGAEVLPILQASNVRKWDRSSNGSIIGKNAAFDPTALRVDRSIDFGPGVSKRQAINHVRGLYARSAGKNWAGTLEFNGMGVFAGEHSASEYETLNGVEDSPLVRSVRDIRPGQNLWAPQFDGGTLFHVSGVDITPGDATTPERAIVTVDTQARDLLELSEILERNVETRRDLRREWKIGNRHSGPSGNQVARDEWFGKLDHNVPLDAGWNVVPFVMGQTGTVSRVRIRTFNDAAEFCIAVFAELITVKQLNHKIGNPMPVDADDETVWDDDTRVADLFDNRILLFIAGSAAQPCGYGRRNKYRADGTTRTKAPLTGTYLSDASWSYITAADGKPFVYLAIYVDRATHLRRGQVFWALPDDVV